LVTMPVIDMTYVTFNRLRLGIHPFTAGRDHLSHLLNSRGFSITKSVIILQLFHILFCLIALFIFLI
jgi:UDP-GlcNAc:undecaprenyl-phosphate GlcNAc-1-phosphate transferase